jgi:chromosomal replication initiation ATPase DnaA
MRRAGADERGVPAATLLPRAALRQLRNFDAEALKLLHLVSVELGVPVAMLLHPSRSRAGIARARQVAMYLCYVMLGRRLATIGRLFGRDRTTVSHACAKVEDLRDDPAFEALVTRLEQAIIAVAEQPREAIRAAG